MESSASDLYNNNNNNDTNNNNESSTMEEVVSTSTAASTSPAPPPSPQTTLSESPIHSIDKAVLPSADNVDRELFNEIESELVSLNLSKSPIQLQSEPVDELKDVQQQPQQQQPKPDETANAMETTTETTCIKETMKMDVDSQTDDLQLMQMEDVPLGEEEPDTLSPLLSDNHTSIIHQEMLVNGHYCDDATKRTLNPLARSFMRLTDVHGDDLHADDSHDSSDEGGCKDGDKKSGEVEGPVEIPDDETCEKIVEQVEFYFSNESLLKDAFLLKHVRRNKEGFVSLKLVSSFKRVRQICRDWRAVGHAIKKCSKKIELNDLNTKIRRLEPLPEHDETLPSRTIVATGLPVNKLTIEKVSDIFSKCGEIALVRILRPGAQIPADVRQFLNKHPELLETECALVEFTESSAARKAQQMQDIYVLELVLPKKKTGKKANVTRLVENLKYSSESENERSRGGESVRFLKRHNSAFYIKPDQLGTNGYVPPPRRMSDSVTAFEQFQAKRFHNMHTLQQPVPQHHHHNQQQLQQHDQPMRRYSACSDGYTSNSDMSRRSSMCSSEMSRRFSNASDVSGGNMRRYSNCSQEMCSSCQHGSRRPSQVSDSFRRISNGSDMSGGSRKFSTGSNFSNFGERRFSNASDNFNGRRISISDNQERKISQGGAFDHSPRKYSNGFDPFRKLSNTDQYYNGRRISTDSGYDRRLSFSSDASAQLGTSPMQHQAPPSPIINRPRAGSLLQDNVVRAPLGPSADGSKGFTRARRFGQVVPPV